MRWGASDRSGFEASRKGGVRCLHTNRVKKNTSHLRAGRANARSADRPHPPTPFPISAEPTAGPASFQLSAQRRSEGRQTCEAGQRGGDDGVEDGAHCKSTDHDRRAARKQTQALTVLPQPPPRSLATQTPGIDVSSTYKAIRLPAPPNSACLHQQPAAPARGTTPADPP